jgi:hypothetical protein
MARPRRQINTILRKKKLWMALNKISGSTHHPPIRGYKKEHNNRLFEHRGKSPYLNPQKNTPQNCFSGIDVKSDLTVSNNKKIQIRHCCDWNMTGS